MLKINEVAKKLGVSVATLRLWDGAGYLTATRTEGNHRRYDPEIVERFRKGERNPNKEKIDSWWWNEALNKLHEKAVRDAVSWYAELLGTVCNWSEMGGFTLEDSCLLYANQRNLEQRVDLGFFHSILGWCSFPYIVNCQPTSTPYGIIDYYRMRFRSTDQSLHMVHETEEYCASYYSEEDDNWWRQADSRQKKAHLEMIRNIDSSVIEDLINCAGTICDGINSKPRSVQPKIAEMFKIIDNKTQVKEPRWIICPPERHSIFGQEIKLLTPNLSMVCEDLDGAKVYMSRLINADTILIGTKSTTRFIGYSVMPFLMTGLDVNRDRYCMVVARRLLREGSQFYGAIKVTD